LTIGAGNDENTAAAIVASCTVCQSDLYELTIGTLHGGNEFGAEFFRRHPLLRSMMVLFDSLPNVFFYMKDVESRFVHLNRANQAIYGVNEEDSLLGKTDRDFHPPALAEAYIAKDQRVISSGEACLNQVWLVPYLDGPLQWFVSSKTPLTDESGKIIGIAGVMYPIETPLEEQARFGRLSGAIREIDSRFTDDLSIAGLAKRCGLSSTHFNRLFRQLLRMSPTDYVLALRIQKARQLLAVTGKSVAEVASETGFYDQSHFTKRFRQATGMTPVQFRQSVSTDALHRES
jgi:AraC-like DNA-binding protein